MDKVLAVLSQPLTGSEKERLNKLFVEKRFKKGELIYKQGERGEGLYIIKNGQASVITYLPGEVKILLATLDKNNFFGEVSLFTKDVTTASVYAETDLSCLLLSHEMLHSLHVVDPEFAYKIETNFTIPICERLRECFVKIQELLVQLSPKKINGVYETSVVEQDIQLKVNQAHTKIKPDDPILNAAFSSIHPEKFSILLPFMKLVEAEKRTVLFRTGQNDQSCYFVLFGAIQNVIECETFNTKFSVNGPGNVVGQLEFVDGKPRVTTAIARESARLLKIDPEQSKILQQEYPELWWDLYFLISKRIAKIMRTTNLQLLRLQGELEYV